MALPYIDIALPGIPPYRLMHVPGGEFLMGANETDTESFGSEKPTHSVRLGEFYIGRFPVTQDIWEAVMGVNPSTFIGPRRPVENVSWNSITEQFLPRLNELTGKKFQLPTEAEWEYAARDGPYMQVGGSLYSDSDALDQVGWYNENSGDGTIDVGLLLPNALGLYDMSGNVWEWCADWYDGAYYAKCKRQGLVDNPLGPESGSIRVLRGGSWREGFIYCRVTYRGINYPNDHDINHGFRLALVL